MDEDKEDPNERRTRAYTFSIWNMLNAQCALSAERMRDSVVQRDDELSDSEDEGEGGRRNEKNYQNDDTTPLSPRISGGGPSPHAARVGIMASMHMEIDDDKIPTSPPVAAATNVATPSLMPDNDAAERTPPDMTPRNFPGLDLEGGGAPDINMDGPPSTIRENRG